MWHRLAITIGATSIGSLLLFGFVFTGTTVRTLRSELDRRAEAGAQLVARQAEGVIRNIEFAGSTVAVVANDAITGIAAAGEVPLAARIDLQNQLSFVLSVFPAVAHAWLVFDPEGVVGVGRLSGAETEVRAFAQRVLPDTAPMGPSVIYGDQTGQIGRSRLLVGKRVIDLATGAPVAALVLAADRGSFATAIQRPDGEPGTRYRIIDGNGVVAGATDALPPRDGVSEFEAQIGRVPWRVVSSVPLRAIRAYTFRVVIVSVALMALVSAAALVVALQLARTFTRPLESLEAQMREMDVERGVGELEVPGSWEIRHVASGANRLLHRVRNLVDRVAREERARQQFRFDLLQAQIKPHFLYNSLEMIHMLGETGQWRRAQRALRNLSDFYRTSLSAGREMISLAEELTLTENYLFIQHLRYGDQLSYEIRSELAAPAAVAVPKLTIQPLVENAIYHGVKGAGHPCTVTVVVRAAVGARPGAGGGWQLSVADDGRGMDEATRAALLSPTASAPAAPEGFGFHSVVERLRLHGSDPVAVEVRSAPGTGTTVTITVGATT